MIVPIESQDITSIHLTGVAGVMEIINIYNNCMHLESLHMVDAYIQNQRQASPNEQRISL